MRAGFFFRVSGKPMFLGRFVPNNPHNAPQRYITSGARTEKFLIRIKIRFWFCWYLLGVRIG